MCMPKYTAIQLCSVLQEGIPLNSSSSNLHGLTSLNSEEDTERLVVVPRFSAIFFTTRKSGNKARGSGLDCVVMSNGN